MYLQEDEEEERQKRLRVEEEEVDVDTLDPMPNSPVTNGTFRAVGGPRQAVTTSAEENEDDAWADGDPDDDVVFDWFPPVQLDDEEDEDDL